MPTRSEEMVVVAVRHRGMLTAAIMLATIMQVLDTTIANVVLPSMQGGLGASLDTITWVLTSYIVAAAIMTPVTGWLSDRFGRRRLFLTSVTGFTIASVLCGLASGIEQMVLFRVLQGVFGAALVPLSQSVLLDINPKERHGQAMALWGAGIMVGPIIGPTLGGWLTEVLDWRWVFYINLPVGILAFAGILIFMPEIAKRARRFDFFGFTMLAVALGSLQMILDRGQQLDWFSSVEIWIESGLLAATLWIFVIHTATTHEGFIDPGIFKNRNFVTGLIFIFIIGIILLASMALLPPMLQKLMGNSTISTGLVLAPRGIGTMVSMIVVGRLIRKIDPRLLIFAGLLLMVWSLWAMTGFTLAMGHGPVIESGLIQGLGLGLVFVPLSTISFATLEARFRTDAASLFSLVRNLGSSIGVSVVFTMLARNTQVYRASLVEHITPFNPSLYLPGMAVPGPGAEQALMLFDMEVSRQAAMIAYLNDFRLMMFITLAAIPMLLLLRHPRRPAQPTADAAALAD